MNPNQYLPIVRRAIAEDLGLAGDLTSDAIAVPAAVSGTIVARGAGTVAGLEVAAAAFTEIDHATVVDSLVKDGTKVTRGTKLIRVQGTARSLLTAERLALNVLGMMSGVATATAQLVDLVKGTGARISDTRKTSPGLRILEKYAVTVGGGINRRFGLHDAVMIKDNHLIIAGGVRRAVEAARAYVGHTVLIEVEVTSLDALRELLDVGADIVLLTNMDLATIRSAVELVDGRFLVEASGGITPETVRAVAEAGVDVISAGWITQSAPSLDVGFDLDDPDKVLGPKRR
ncbi:MAG TPA: carboxylating nicotinate-nucleotide diphosphorylase [Acidimicrobiia bacterium]